MSPTSLAESHRADIRVPSLAVARPANDAAASLPADALSPARIIEMGAAFWPSKVLLTAVELGVFTTVTWVACSKC